jgi:hypothetical protein
MLSAVQAGIDLAESFFPHRGTVKHGPGPFDIAQVAGDLGEQSQGIQEALVLQPVVDEGPFAASFEDLSLPQGFQVMGDQGLGHTRRLDNFINGAFPVTNVVDDPQTIGITQLLEKAF